MGRETDLGAINYALNYMEYGLASFTKITRGENLAHARSNGCIIVLFRDCGQDARTLSGRRCKG
jgi:hypothetical protein